MNARGYLPGDKTRCTACGLTITLELMHSEPFHRYWWWSKLTGEDCRPRDRRRHSGHSHSPRRT